MAEPPALIAYRLRTVRVGIQATALVLASLIAFMFIPSDIRIDEGSYLLVLAIAAAVALVVAALPWLKLFERGWGLIAMYAWSAFDIILITGVLASVGTNGAPLFVLYGLTTVFASASYRPLPQAALWVFTLICYVTMVLAVEGKLVFAATVVRFTTLAGIAFIAGFLSRELQMQNRKLEREVAERKATEERLLASETALEEAQRIAHLGSWEWDLSANRVTWSEELLRIFGVERSEFGGDYNSFLALVHPEDRRWVHELVQSALAEREAFTYEHRVVTPNGTEKVLLSRGSIEVDQSGDPSRVIGTSLDLTDRKKAEGTERELADLAGRQQQAMEINDNVVQGLTVAAYSLNAGDKERAGKAIKATLGASRKIVEKLLSDRYDRMKPGDFVRSEPAHISLDDDEPEKRNPGP